MFLPVAPWWIVLIIILVMAYDIKKKRTIKPTLFEIKYESLSEKRKQKARDCADRRGFIYLGDAKQQIDDGLSWYMEQGENVVCRFDGDDICFYSIEDKKAFFAGIDSPKLLPYSISIFRIVNIQAWYKPGGDTGIIRIDLHQLPGFGCEFVNAWTTYQPKKLMTDALILIQERTEAYIKK